MTHLQQIDHAIARLLCDSGTPARLVDYTAWKGLLRLVNPDLEYTSPSSSYVRDKLIPTESMRAVLHIRDFLKTQTNLSLSFDGLTAGEQPVYMVHVCTPDRYTFLYYADIFYGSHDSNYIEDLLVKVVNELGPHRISLVVSDNTSVTRKARLMVTARNTSIMNLADPIHKLNLCIQDICLDRLWTSIVDRLRKLLKHLKMVINATGKLNAARKVLGIVRTLQSIGKTRFATIYYASLSVLENLPALYQIYRNGEINTTGNPLPDAVAEVLDENQFAAFEFKAMLTELVRILEPLARALLCFESTHSTISHIYYFWLAALALLNRYFSSKSSGQLLTAQDKSHLQAIIFYRFSEAINEAPTDAYVTGFFLNPRFRTIPIYIDSSDIHAPHSTVAFDYPSSSRRKVTRPASRLTQSLYSRIRRQLLLMLRDELSMGQTTPEHPLYQYDALRAKNELIAQLQRY
ncbi:hypothetical protein RhiJN_24957 [Ceratobasidium sp. AG-Ba]|nr:hypothetical protein RhiJN_24957 [Ceratobasidium sp. AG-Ba]